MKQIVLLLFFSTGISTSHAGSVIYKNMYSKESILQGTGSSYAEAEKDALSALPDGWEFDPGNSPGTGCITNFGNNTKDDCNLSIPGNKATFSVPIVPKDPKQRETYFDQKPWLVKGVNKLKESKAKH